LVYETPLSCDSFFRAIHEKHTAHDEARIMAHPIVEQYTTSAQPSSVEKVTKMVSPRQESVAISTVLQMQGEKIPAQDGLAAAMDE